MCLRKAVLPSQAMQYSSLATLCPACPQLAINMPSRPPERPDPEQQVSLLFSSGWSRWLTHYYRFLDALYHAVDGNFTQNLKDKGSDTEDMPLTLGAAYFANEHDARHYFSSIPPPKTQVRAPTAHKNRLLSSCIRRRVVTSLGLWATTVTGGRHLA
jgi:hypothetical protein